MRHKYIRIAVIFGLALLVRLSAALILGNQVSGLSGAQDEISYSMLGQRFATGYGLTFPNNWYPWILANHPQSYYSAIMSLTLAGIYTLFGYYPLIARIIFALLGASTVVLIYLLTRRFFGENVALLAGIIASFYSYLIFYSITLVTETPFIFFLTLSLLIAYHLRDDPRTIYWVLLGVTLAVTVLFRMAVIFYVPVLIFWIFYTKRKLSWKFLIPFLIIVLAILPFTIRNYILWGRFMLLESQFGHVFWNGNNPGFLGNFHPYRVFPIPENVLSSHNDAIITSKLLGMGIENVIKDPGSFFLLTLTRLREFFKFWPTSDSNLIANILRVTSFGIMWPFSVAGLFLSRKKWPELFPLYSFMIIHTGVYAITWTMIRYRIPLDALLIPFASLALVYSYEKLKLILRVPSKEKNMQGTTSISE